MATLDDVLIAVNKLKEGIEQAMVLNKISPAQISVTSLSEIDENLGLIEAGEFRAGNGVDPGNGFTGIRITIDGVNGYNNDVLQAGLSSTDGTLIAGAGGVTIDSNGIRILSDIGDRFGWVDSNGNSLVYMDVDSSAPNVIYSIGARTPISGAITDTTFYISASGQGRGLLGNPGIQLKSPKTGAQEIVLNYNSDDVDTHILGDGEYVLTVDGSANSVGIGVVNPDAKLEVDGTLHIQDTVTFEKGLVVNEGSNDADTRIEGNGDANLVFVDAGNDRVGIGTATPAVKLDVVGDINASGEINVGTFLELGDTGMVRGGAQTLTDDTQVNFTPASSNGGILLWGLSAAGDFAFVGFNTATPSTVGHYLGSNVVVTTGALGDETSTGTDGKITVSCHTDGKIYIKNRMGGNRIVRWVLFGNV